MKAKSQSVQNRAVIFDLGNVVIDWNVDGILNSLGLETEQQKLLGKELFHHQDWLDLDHGIESELNVISKICQRSSLNRDLVERAFQTAKGSLYPISETLLLMQELSSSGIRMFCLSNMSRETYAHIQSMDFFDMFSGIVISGIEGCMKPDDEIFHLTLNRFDLDPVDTLFVDDSLVNIDTARRLGINGYHFKRSKNCYLELRALLF